MIKSRLDLGFFSAKGNTPGFPTSEFNFSCDPEAAAFVFEKVGCMIQLVGFSTCMESGIPWVRTSNPLLIFSSPAPS
jgi:hypothetical protein